MSFSLLACLHSPSLCPCLCSVSSLDPPPLSPCPVPSRLCLRPLRLCSDRPTSTSHHCIFGTSRTAYDLAPIVPSSHRPIHTYIHTHAHTYILIYIHNIHTYTHACIPPSLSHPHLRPLTSRTHVPFLFCPFRFVSPRFGSVRFGSFR